MDSRERVRRALRRQETDRIPCFDHFWTESRQGLVREAGAHPDTDINDLFDLDCRCLGFDQSPRLDTKTIREDDREIVTQNAWGITIRHFRHKQTTGEHIDFLAKTPEIWRTSYRPRFVFKPERVNLDRARLLLDYWRRQGRYVFFQGLEPFEAAWHCCGPEEHLAAYAEDPEWIADIYRVHTDLWLQTFAYFRANGIDFDGVWCWGDIAYKNATMVSPKAYRELLLPCHKRICDAAHAAGCDTLFHSDGHLQALLPHLIEAGWDCLQPIEVKAGMDVRELKAQIGGRMSFMGNIDARLYAANDVEGLERELRSKMSVAAKGGGYIYHSDHSVPPGVKLATYRRVLEVVRAFKVS